MRRLYVNTNNRGLKRSPIWKGAIANLLGLAMILAIAYSIILLLWAATPDPFYG